MKILQQIDKPVQEDGNTGFLFVKGHINPHSRPVLHITIKNTSEEKAEIKAGVSVAQIGKQKINDSSSSSVC